MAFEVAEVVLEKMKGDFSAFRRMPVRYQARNVATLRVKRMLEVAQEHDRKRRKEMLDAQREAEQRMR